MFHDLKVSAATLVELTGWLAGLALVLLQLFTRFPTGQLGILIAGASGVMQIKGGLHRQHRRERNAYELGAESSQVTRINR